LKTAISDPVFKIAERFAKRLDLPRSELCVWAISSYIEERKGRKVTELLNEMYGDAGDQGVAKDFKKAQMKSIDREEW